MDISVGAAISDLLYERETVILPDFGGFVAAYQGAAIDQVQGILHPPSKNVGIDENLTYDDGVLAAYIAGKYGISQELATAEIKKYVASLKTKLKKREIVPIPDVGRVYYDFEKKLQFLPDNTNFNKESFGLPAIHFYPVLRNREKKEKSTGTTAAAANPLTRPIQKKPAASTAAKSTHPTHPFYTITNQLLPWLIGVAVIAICIVFYFFWKAYTTTAPGTDDARLSQIEDRLNRKPSQEDLLADTTASEASEPITGLDSEAPPATPQAVTIVGGFSKKSNAEALIEEIYQAGYNAFSDKKGILTRVGVQFAYDSTLEIDQKLKEVKARFNKNAWVLQPEGYSE